MMLRMSDGERTGCLAAILKLFMGPKPAATALPYRRRDYLLTKAERSFYGALCQAVGQDHLVFAKVRVADLLWMPKGTEGRQSHFNKIQSKHADFVLCDTEQVRPVLVIELDDSSHSTDKRVARDNFLDEAFRVAGLPILRVRCQSGYNIAELREQIIATLRQA